MIKMKINREEGSVCEECGCRYADTPEMYTLLICGKRFDLCKSCIEMIFQKALKASCAYNAKIKSSKDMQRISNFKKRKGREDETLRKVLQEE